MKQLSRFEILIMPLLVLVCLTTACGIAGSEKTIADYTRAIELNPDDTSAYNDRGIAYADSGDLYHAILDFSKVIELDPDYAMAYNNRGISYRASGAFQPDLSPPKRTSYG